MQNNSYDYKSLSKFIKNLRLVFDSYYDETKKIFITTEQLGGFSNTELFFYLTRILDEIFLACTFKDSDTDERKQRIINIERHFLNAQNYAMIAGLGEIVRYSKEKNYKINEIFILKNDVKILLKEILGEKFDEEKEYFYSGARLEIIKELDRVISFQLLKKYNLKLKKLHYRCIDILIPNWNAKKSWSEFVNKKIYYKKFEYYRKFNNLICIEYKLARRGLFDIFRRQGYHYTYSVTELRDAIDHISRTLQPEKYDAITEISHASEHIRRATVESVQDYCLRILEDKVMQMNGKKKSSKNYNKIYEAKKYICIARYLKGVSSWYLAIVNFYKAISILEEKLNDD